MRRLFFAGLVLVSAVFWSGSAAGISLTLGGFPGGNGPGTFAHLTVMLDTEATTGITLLSVGVLFDDTRMLYRQDLSSTTSYILYGGKGGGGYLRANGTCGGGPGSPTAGDGCSLRVNTTNQINIDFVSTDLSNGTQNTGSGILLATLVFECLPGFGSAAVTLSQTSPGNVIGQPGGTSTTATLLGSGNCCGFPVPEPSTAILFGLGLAGMAAGRWV